MSRRQMPYPYRAMLAICSDLDETPDRRVYQEIMRFLNTTSDTAMGPGVGLEVGNTIYFDMPPGQFAYWSTDDAGRQMVRTWIQSGHIDCLHSYGDLATTRTDAARALEELVRHDCRLQVWIDHGTAATNFDPLIMHGHGDDPGHEAYHADLTTDYGVQYVWRGRVTSIIGQDVPPRSRGIFRWDHPVASGRTLLKELAKRRLAQAGSEKYAMHGPNETLRPITLRDGRSVYEFMRCNPHWGGVSMCDQGRHIGSVLTSRMLSCLVKRGGTCVLYTHLGKVDDPRTPFSSEAVNAFRRLAEESRAGRILVTTTRRLLGYRRAAREIMFDVHTSGKGLAIHIHAPTVADSIDELSGLSFYVPDPGATHMTVNGQEVSSISRNPPDHTGRRSVSVPWRVLEFPQA
ncbi:MAG: hypothetical protein JW955_06270 [Sedimentisphaerales bacterium]|nr:hypothetical protein [Sedimentisphaerales bacterium]